MNRYSEDKAGITFAKNASLACKKPYKVRICSSFYLSPSILSKTCTTPSGLLCTVLDGRFTFSYKFTVTYIIIDCQSLLIFIQPINGGKNAVIKLGKKNLLRNKCLICIFIDITWIKMSSLRNLFAHLIAHTLRLF